jgi:hypothetical protein
MRVLPLEGYDGILGMDWLAKWGLMTCEWEHKWIEFTYLQNTVRLTGLSDVSTDTLQAVSMEELIKCFRGNDIWVVAELCVTDTSVHVTAEIPAKIQTLL